MTDPWEVEAAKMKQQPGQQQTGQPQTAQPAAADPWSVGSSGQTEEPSLLRKLGGAGLDLVKGIGEGAVHTVSGTDDWAAKHLPAWFTTPIGEAATPENQAKARAYTRDLETPADTMQGVGKFGEQAGEFLLPGPAEEKLAGYGAAGLSRLGVKAAPTLAKMGASAVGSGVVNAAQGGSFGGGAAAGAVGAGVGAGLKKMAPIIAEKAVGIRPLDRMFNRTPGEAVLSETTGFRPGTIARQANEKVAEMTKGVEHGLEDAPDGSLAPARDVADSYIKTAVARNTPESIKRTTGLRKILTTKLGVDGKPVMLDKFGDVEKPTGILDESGNPILRTDRGVVGEEPAEYPEQVPARTLLDLKRGVGEQHQAFNQTVQNKLSDNARLAIYHALDAEMDRVAPHTEGLNSRVSTLMPAADRAGAKDLNESLTARILTRGGARTGAGMLGAAGAYEGNREGGIPGMILGGAAGMIVPELATDPTFLMMGARAANSPGLRKFAIPAAQGAGLNLFADRPE